ncbi:hypothetical protein Lser_V15G27708 [Lactuca serriola]
MAINKPTIIILIIATVAALAIPSASATEHIVGGDKGWVFGFDYQTWALQQRFYVGDKLVFNYPVGKYNVFEVGDAGWEDCYVSSKKKGLTSGHDVITLETPGNKFFICQAKNDEGKRCCEEGSMKFHITVFVPNDPGAPGKLHVVGDDKGWTLNVDYQAWANGKKFNIGDQLLFKYPAGKHSVFQAIDETSFKECIPPNADEGLSNGYDIVTLDAPDTWFICGAPDHCKKGMKFFVHASDPSKSPGFQGSRKLIPPKL